MDIVLKEKYSNLFSKLIQTNVDYVTCLECCKYYVVPTTASCGHSLCHTCWYGRQTCPNCRGKIDRKSLKLNMVLQNFTEDIHNLQDVLKDIFGPTTDYNMSSMDNRLLQDSIKNVNEWLSSSQNRFSVPVTTLESIPELTIPSKILDKDIQLYQENKITAKAVLIDQNDWDKIEVLPESDDILSKDKENIIGPMDIEQLETIDEYEEYSTDNLRRSSRNKHILLSNEQNTGSSVTKIIKNKNTNNWSTVKNMKQEFSKLNKQAKSKLNVSVEMTKTIQNCKKKLVPLENTCKISDVDIVSSFTENENIIKNTVQVHSENIIKKQSDEYTIENRKKSCKETTDSSKNLISLGPLKRNKQTNLSKTLEEKASNSQGNNHSKNNVKFFKRSPWSSRIGFKDEDNEHLKNQTSEIVNTDDIEITIKVGKTVANICIKKKDNNVNVKVNSEREIQSSISQNNVSKICVSTSPLKDNLQEKRKTELVNQSIQAFVEIDSVKKKNIASADTSSLNTAKKTIGRLSSINEIEEIINTNNSCPEMVQPKLNKDPKDCLNDFDMFDSESVKDGNIQPLSRTIQTPSAIFMPSNVSKLKSQNKSSKRERDESETYVPNKKGKTTPTMSAKRNLITLNESEPGDYNEILDQVFANIKEDMKGDKATDSANYISNTQKIHITSSQKSNKFQIKSNIKDNPTQKCSENIFSLLEHELELDKSQGKHKSIDVKKTKSNEIAEKINTQLESTDSDMAIVPSTPQNDDSDKSVVEETPQKDISHKQMDSIKSRRESKRQESVVTLDITNDTKVTVIEKKPSIETPASMYKFVNNLYYKSTPIAKKSLDFNYPEQMCAINTQEREIMSKAFEQLKPENKIKKYCLVVSCLTQPDIAKVKLLCTQRKWTFVDKFTPDVTHLIVSVTDDNRAQRSVKFICALAASKWILSMEWIHKCINSKEVVNEEPHEVLDMTGEPGPRRSRLARQKLFNGIKFYCMPPFGQLDIEKLKEILVYAGGEVVNDIKDVKATDTPSLLLAEPESTQEDRFIKLAAHLSVVPVNYEWVLNSLGSYTLATIVDLLLCPESLLPQVIMKWPRALISSQDSIED